MTSRALLLVFLFVEVGVLTAQDSSQTKGASVAALCEQGLLALRRDSLHNAQAYFTAASQAGMSRDSLYYFLSKLFFVKGAFDTALAFNFGMKPTAPDLVVWQLSQRMAIYTALGWNGDAQYLADSLLSIPRRRRHPYLPDAGIQLGADYAQRKETDQVSFPFDGPFAPQYYKGPGYNGMAYARWEIPLARPLSLGIGMQGTLTSMYYRTSMSQDSVNRSVGMSASLEHRPSGLSIAYDVRRSIDFADQYTTQNSVGVSRAKNGRKWMTLFSGGYDIETGADWVRQNQRVWAVGYADQTMIASRGWTVQLMASYYDAGPVRQAFDSSTMAYYFDIANVMYVDDVRASQPVHYANGTSTDTVPRSLLSYEFNSLANAKMLDFRTYSQRQISVEPTIKYTVPLLAGITAIVAFGTSVTYYTEPFLWLTTADPDSALVFVAHPIIVYNERDGNYYWYLEPKTSLSGDVLTERFGASPVNRQKYRTDAAFEISLSIKRTFGAFGTLQLKADASKTYSTLRKLNVFSWQISNEDAPFAVPDLSWSVGLSWIFDFRAD